MISPLRVNFDVACSAEHAFAIWTARIEHRGWERLGEMADAWRDRNRIGWETLLPHFAVAIMRGDS